MPATINLRDHLTDCVVFLQEFLKHPHQVGSVIPSSRFLERRIVELADIAAARTVVELGSGTGGTTRALLGAMSPDARLLSMEINPKFCELIERIDDARLIVHEGYAQTLPDALALYGLPAPDAIVSGIPFSTMGREVGALIIQSIAATLSTGGRFVAYQVSGTVAELTSPVLGTPRFEVESLNIPPMRLYRWDKQ